MSQERTVRPGKPRRASGPGAAAHGAPWLRLSIAAGVLAVAGSVVGLGVGGFYANLTPAFLPQALAQDVANLALAAPALLVCALLALRGSLRARLVWLGVLAFTVYNYVIYTFSIPFGPLFPLWVAVLGLSLFSLIGGVASTDAGAVAARFESRPAILATAWSLIVVGALFGLLWLSEDVPALLSGTTPRSVLDLGIPTNPVHILDLAFFLPAVVGTGILLLRRRAQAYPVAPAFLVFLILTGVPIMVTPVVQSVRGETAAWTVLAPIGVLTVLMLVLLTWLLRTVGSPDRAGAHGRSGEPAG
ncbi:hypothetical protein RCH16_001686 [Cryobacterium sp. MP_M5]|uniref:hypothetical protein n=1 Tax=unclassified Cryobacterium TaxID=2649013 RepID=UPI0018CB79D8|nr:MULTISPECIES: hypothetical protein [unclassified Cryobacterium]MBG6058078.1 hypothetical protein [Cryobacterium sp. MP_M3]MEC5176678.1 hypothetical protein [Cryobacterium sp. MP_M5]